MSNVILLKQGLSRGLAQTISQGPSNINYCHSSIISWRLMIKLPRPKVESLGILGLPYKKASLESHSTGEHLSSAHDKKVLESYFLQEVWKIMSDRVNFGTFTLSFCTDMAVVRIYSDRLSPCTMQRQIRACEMHHEWCQTSTASIITMHIKLYTGLTELQLLNALITKHSMNSP